VAFDERLAIEAEEAAVGSDPEIAVGGLRDAVDLATGKSIASVPGGPQILRDGAVGIESITGDPQARLQDEEHGRQP
jgi:hypothetical protein